MTTEQVFWLHERHTFSIEEFREHSGLSETELRELVDCGVLAPNDPRELPWTFGADLLVVARSACRLRRDFDLDANGIALALALLDRVHDLEAELREVRARLPRWQR
jgi:chaperone modulatory protein CbpM